MAADPALSVEPTVPPATGSRRREGPALLGWWTASVAAAVVHNGLWATPNLAFFSLISAEMGRNPFTPGTAGDYLLTDVSLTGLAALVHQHDAHQFARLHLVVLVLAWAAVVLLAWRAAGYATARALTVLLGAAPLITVSMQWLGQPDPLTGLCGVAMVLVRRRWAVAVLGLVAGLTHPEQALFMALVLGGIRPPVRAVLDGTPPRRWWSAVAADLVAATGGVVAGRLATQTYFLVAGITLRTSRADYLRYGVDRFLDHHGRQPFALAWTLWGPLWLVVVALAVLLWRRAGTVASAPLRRLALVTAAAAVASLAPVAVTLDETRVYAVVTAPLLVALAVLAAGLVQGRTAAWWAAAFLVLTAALPGGFATGVTSWRSQLAPLDMAVFLWDGSRPDDSGADLTAWLLGPFDFVIPELPAD